MLWIYIENDTFFGPSLSNRMHEAFTAEGGKAEYRLMPPFGNEGHVPAGQAGRTHRGGVVNPPGNRVPRTVAAAAARGSGRSTACWTKARPGSEPISVRSCRPCNRLQFFGAKAPSLPSEQNRPLLLL